MIISFDQIPGKELPNFKGGEKSFDVKMVDAEDGNRFMLGLLKPGATIGMHTHTGNCEVVYILEGCGSIVEKDGIHPVQAGMCLYCPSGESHSLQNTSQEDLRFFATVVRQ